MTAPRIEMVDNTARIKIEGLQSSIGEVKLTLHSVQGDVRQIRDDVHDAKLGFTTEIHAAMLKMSPLGVWVKILSGAAIALTFGVFSLVGTLIWKAVTNHIDDRAPAAEWQERLAPDRVTRRAPPPPQAVEAARP